MKKTFFVTLIILALIISLLPLSSAFAKREVGFVNVEVRNMTGAPISVVITDALGLYSNLYTYEPGIWYLTIQKGEYLYNASTSCGMVSGSANFDRTKKLAFHCRPGAESSVYRAAPGCFIRGNGNLKSTPIC
ncbi:MAG: hypothetical protein WCP19_14205 [Chloroflexota bacterium]